MAPPRVGVAGLGYWGPNLVRNFDEIAELAWICDLDNDLRSRFASRYTQARATADFAEMLADESLDAVVVATPVPTHYALAKQAQVYVGGDTGPTHLAVAARTPIVGLFGPTEWWRNGSPYSDDVCVERNDIDCRVDCHRRSCSKWICMDIDVGRVLHAVTDRLRRAGRIAAAELVTIG